jgi:hypothetical protein
LRYERVIQLGSPVPIDGPRFEFKVIIEIEIEEGTSASVHVNSFAVKGDLNCPVPGV